MTNIFIRPATLQDAELIADLSRETFFDTYAEHNTREDMDKFLTQQFNKEILLSEAGVDHNIFFLAYTGEEPAGYIFLKKRTVDSLESNNAIEIYRLYARKHFIGKGIGKALMETAIKHARSNGNEYIWLCVWEHNHRAIKFYSSFGFKKFGEHNFTLGDDIQVDWMMKLQATSY